MTLHEQILAEIERLVALAEVATPWKAYPDSDLGEIRYGDFGPGIVGSPMGEWEDSEQGRRDAAFARSVANPADALRRYAHYRKVLERHRPPDAVPIGADALRRYAHYRKVLERHRPPDAVPIGDPGPYPCVACSHAAGPMSHWVDTPCPEVRDVAEALGIEVES